MANAPSRVIAAASDSLPAANIAGTPTNRKRSLVQRDVGFFTPPVSQKRDCADSSTASSHYLDFSA